MHNLPGQTTPLYLYGVKQFPLCPVWYFSILSLLSCLLPTQCFQGHGSIFSVWFLSVFFRFPWSHLSSRLTRPGPSASPFRVNSNLYDSGSLPLNSCLCCSGGGGAGPKLDAIFLMWSSDCRAEGGSPFPWLLLSHSWLVEQSFWSACHFKTHSWCPIHSKAC